jgi:hydrogenase nickel incorporation protein HypA/HybF
VHELSLAENVLDIVENAAREQAFERVHTLRLSVPALAGVEVEALRLALASLAPGTVLDGAGVEIDEPPGRAWCADCACEVDLHDRLDPCPNCGGDRLRVVGGTALRVLELLVPETVGRSQNKEGEGCV